MYNFVIFAHPQDYYSIAYSDIINLDNVKYQKQPIANNNFLLNQMYNFHMSSKINEIVNLPGKGFWKDKHYKNEFKDNTPICFVFFSNWIRTEGYGFIDFLKTEYPHSKYVCYFQDLISKKRNVDVKKLKLTYDLIITFDSFEAIKYKIEHYPFVYSKVDTRSLKENNSESDVYFLGYAKDRLNLILSIFEKLNSEGIKCDFNLAGVPKKHQLYKDKINYIKKMPYIDNLNHIKSTKTILEIIQGNANGYTLRMCESIMYDKKILTNNQSIVDSKLYNKDYVSLFNDMSDIDFKFLKSKPVLIDNSIKDYLSPLNLLSFIEKKIAE